RTDRVVTAVAVHHHRLGAADVDVDQRRNLVDGHVRAVGEDREGVGVVAAVHEDRVGAVAALDRQLNAAVLQKVGGIDDVVSVEPVDGDAVDEHIGAGHVHPGGQPVDGGAGRVTADADVVVAGGPVHDDVVFLAVTSARTRDSGQIDIHDLKIRAGDVVNSQR